MRHVAGFGEEVVTFEVGNGINGFGGGLSEVVELLVGQDSSFERTSRVFCHPQVSTQDWPCAACEGPFRVSVPRFSNSDRALNSHAHRSAAFRRRTTLRIMTYNVHFCRGMDRRLSPERVARVIDHCNVDIAALQELDVRRARSDGVDQARRIAEILGWNYYFGPALSLAGDEHYGDAILSRLPMELIQAHNLPGSHLRSHLEPRGALWVNVMIGQRSLQLVNTHLGLLRAERQLQVEALLGPDWLGHPKCSGPKVLCGDFNALPHSVVYRRLTSSPVDVQHSRLGRRRATFSSALPLLSIDHIFVDGLRVIAVESPRHFLVRHASDHLPLVAELAIEVD